MLKFLQRLGLDFPYICSFSQDFLTNKCIENLKKVVLGLVANGNTFNFFSVDSLGVKL